MKSFLKLQIRTRIFINKMNVSKHMSPHDPQTNFDMFHIHYTLSLPHRELFIHALWFLLLLPFHIHLIIIAK